MNAISSAPLQENDLEAISTPLGFSKALLKLDSYGWSENVLFDLDQSGFIAVRAANGVGKTTRLGVPAALWNAAVHPGSLTLASAGVYRQVGEFFNGIRAHQSKFPEWEFLESEVRTPSGSRIIGFTADRPELFEGYHNDNLLIVLDESKAIPDGVYQSALRCQPKRMLLLSSPGARNGFFYEAFTSRRKHFKTHVIKAFDAAHIDPKWIQDVIEQYGETHPFTRSSVFAEFSDGEEEGAVIPLSFIEHCIASPPAFEDDGTVQAFCDFAAGGDENVLAVRRGNKVEIIRAWRERDTMKGVGAFIQLFIAEKLNPADIRADEGGLGRVMCDRLAEQGWSVRRVNNGARATKPNVYANKGAEFWYEGRAMVEQKRVILPNDKILISQLSSRKGGPRSDGRLALESKEQMRARGMPSPDRADAVLGAVIRNMRSKVLFG